tara:strand:- start:574 stop:729 length:156 start_codon:yes stop_codon:yes gene_type:complete
MAEGRKGDRQVEEEGNICPNEESGKDAMKNDGSQGEKCKLSVCRRVKKTAR